MENLSSVLKFILIYIPNFIQEAEIFVSPRLEELFEVNLRQNTFKNP